SGFAHFGQECLFATYPLIAESAKEREAEQLFNRALAAAEHGTEAGPIGATGQVVQHEIAIDARAFSRRLLADQSRAPVQETAQAVHWRCSLSASRRRNASLFERSRCLCSARQGW